MSEIKTMAQYAAEGKMPEVLFWVGCAGSFDPRAKKVTRAFAKILQTVGTEFAILGNEETCTGDPARRAGNEFLFQMLAIQNIETLKGYSIAKIVTTCPHCFNTLKNEYPQYDGQFEVLHHTEYIQNLLDSGKLKIAKNGPISKQKLTYHDSCYMGRVNGVYEIPRKILLSLQADIKELASCKSRSLCCGAGGGQMFKEDEPGDKRINLERAEEIVATETAITAANCPFCLTMIQDGMKALDKQDEIMVYDLAELIIQQNNW